jgi:hypothetical protein
MMVTRAVQDMDLDPITEIESEDEKMPEDAHSRNTTPFGTETDAQRIAHLESELKAAGRNNALLQEAATKVVWSNEHLRAGMREAILGLAEAQFLEPQKKLADTAAGLDAMMGLPGTMAGLVLVMEKAS